MTEQQWRERQAKGAERRVAWEIMRSQDDDPIRGIASALLILVLIVLMVAAGAMCAGLGAS